MAADFGGYATRYNIKCSDGRTIKPGAFTHMDGKKVPLMWQHLYNEPENVLGHAILRARDDGLYAEGFFNKTARSEHAKVMVHSEDIVSLSIYANDLKEKNGDVFFGNVRELSLVVSGANPGSFIDNLSFQHGDSEEVVAAEAIIYSGIDHLDQGNQIKHTETQTPQEDNMGKENPGSTPVSELAHAADQTVADVFNSLTEEQKNVVYYLIGEIMDSEDPSAAAQHSDTGDDMARNVFTQADGSTEDQNVLSHSQIDAIFDDAKKTGSLKEAFLAHAANYGITNIDLLFPDAKLIAQQPEFISRTMDWVTDVVDGAHHSPFSRIKMMQADITEDDARARGYIKGNLKKEEFFKLIKRTTSPTTIYKKQKLDRDDIIDITDLNVVAWIKAEMRVMLKEEIARAVLLGDGRAIDSMDKIDEDCIRPIVNEHDLYAPKVDVMTNAPQGTTEVTPDILVDAIILSSSKYKGSSPTLFVSNKFRAKLLTARDKDNRRQYKGVSELAADLGVNKITAVDLMDDYIQTDTNGQKWEILGIMVNMNDYTIGADAGGEISMFDDFDIDYNQYKYLMETRISGSLTKIGSALILRRKVA